MDASLPPSLETPQKPDYKSNEEYKDIIRKIRIGHKRLDKFLCQRFPKLLEIQKKTSIPTSVISYATSLFALWFAKYLFGARFLTNSIAASFPIYCTQIVLKGKHDIESQENSEAMKRLLSFWLYAFLFFSFFSFSRLSLRITANELTISISGILDAPHSLKLFVRKCSEDAMHLIPSLDSITP